jgi:hypothetical protein
MAKIQKGQLLNISQVLSELAQSNDENVKFKYAIAKNNKIIEQEVSVLTDMQKPSEAIQGFEQKRQMLCIENCIKTEDGRPDIKDNQFQIEPEKLEEFNVKMKTLYDDNKEVLDAEQAKRQAFYDFLSEEIDIPFYTISIDNVSGKLTQQQVNILTDFIIVG